MPCLMCGDKGRILYFYDRPGSPQGNQYINCPLCEANRTIEILKKKLKIEEAWRNYEQVNYTIVTDLCFMWRTIYRKLKNYIREQRGQPKGTRHVEGDLDEFALRVYKHNDLLERRDEARKRLKDLGET